MQSANPFQQAMVAESRRRVTEQGESQPASLGDVDQPAAAVGLVEAPEHRVLLLAVVAPLAETGVETATSEGCFAVRRGVAIGDVLLQGAQHLQNAGERVGQ